MLGPLRSSHSGCQWLSGKGFGTGEKLKGLSAKLGSIFYNARLLQPRNLKILEKCGEILSTELIYSFVNKRTDSSSFLRHPA